jgi:hypothetical protein
MLADTEKAAESEADVCERSHAKSAIRPATVELCGTNLGCSQQAIAIIRKIHCTVVEIAPEVQNRPVLEGEKISVLLDAVYQLRKEFSPRTEKVELRFITRSHIADLDTLN